VLAASALLALPTPGGAAPLDDLKAKVAAAQHAADAAAQAYADGETRRAQLAAEVSALEDRIRAGKAEARTLRERARRRAVEAYTGRFSSLDDVFDVGDDMLDGIRREQLIGATKKRDETAVERLGAVNDRLDVQRREVEARRAEQAAALDSLRTEQARLQDELRGAQRAQAQLEEELRKQLEAAQAAAKAQQIARQARTKTTNATKNGPAPVNDSGMICPIRGPVSFVDSYGAPRPQGPHMGVDLMSPHGTPNVAVVSGDVQFKSGGRSGLGARLYGDNGTLYYYFHLSAYEGGPRHVQQGDVIGYVGNTGDASGGAPHTHFEVHPGGGNAVNPYPYVAAVC
jgi:murein DD-endopeptidase MepM/ murein hydrolase activator NlpD